MIDYNKEWLESIGFRDLLGELTYFIDTGYGCHEYMICCDNGEWSLIETFTQGLGIMLPTPMTKEKVLEYIAFVKGMVNQ